MHKQKTYFFEDKSPRVKEIPAFQCHSSTMLRGNGRYLGGRKAEGRGLMINAFIMVYHAFISNLA